MRLICPNCDAQYEVPIEVMPPDGRDVQCSNCGQTWFQEHPDHPSEKQQEPSSELVDEKEDDAPDPGSVPQNLPDEEIEIGQAPIEEIETPATNQSGDAEPALPERRELDPAVADVLRAEAELEAQARRIEAIGLESQPDLGLSDAPDDADERARETRDRMAKLQDEYLDDEEDEQEELLAATATSAMGSRRDLLPNIEEINSTLRSNNDRSPAADPGQTAQIEEHEKRSSRLGFSLTVGLVALLVLLYVFAPKVVDAIPQAGPALEAYVSTVDGWRAWLDSQISVGLNWLDQAALSSGQ